MEGSLKLTVEFPGKKPVTLDGLADSDEPRRRRRAARGARRSGCRISHMIIGSGNSLNSLQTSG